MIRRRKFLEGIRLKGSTNATTLEGEVRLDPSALKFKAYVNGSERSVVTEDQTQTLTNKTITNPVLNGTVTGTVIDTDGTLAANSDIKIPSQQAVKEYVDNAVASVDDASEIDYDPSSNPETIATNVQDALDDTGIASQAAATAASDAQTDIDDHIADSADAHTASAITNVASGNLAADNVQDALDELQTDIDTRALDSALTAHINDSEDAHDASAISYDNATSGLVADEVQAAIDEVEDRVDTAETDILANASDLTDHIAETSTHGVSGDIVGTSDVQVITNKDIDGGTASNTNRITLPKSDKATLDGLTRKEGTVVYASDEEKAYIDNGTDLIPVGSGSGGTLDTFYTETFDLTSASDFTKGNDADFDGGGSLDGTLSDETSSPISGDASLKYTMGATSTDDYIKSPDIALDRKQKGQTIGMEFYYTYDGADDDIKIVIYDDTNSQVLTTSIDFLKASSTPQRFSVQVPTNSDTANLHWGFQVVTGNSGKILVIDDIQMSTNPYTNYTFDKGIVGEIISSGSTETPLNFLYCNGNAVSRVVYSDLFAQIGTNFGVGDGSTTFNVPDLRGQFLRGQDDGAGVDIDGAARTVGDYQSDENKAHAHDYQTTRPRDVAGVQNAYIGYGQNNSASNQSGKIYSSGGSESRPKNVAVRYYVRYKNDVSDVLAYNSRNAENSMVRLHTGNGHGSTNNKIRRFSTVVTNTGNAITYADSATDGASFTINEDGLYSMSYSDQASSDSQFFGFSLNSTQLTTSIYTINAADRLAHTQISDITFGSNSNVSWQGLLQKGDIIRPHESGSLSSVANVNFTISKIGVGDLLGVPKPRTCYIKDVKASGANGGTFTSGAWRTRDLNTLEGDTEFVSLSANQVTVSEGKYEITMESPAYNVNRNQVRIANITASTYIYGTSLYATSAAPNGNTVSKAQSIIEITAPTIFEFQHRCESTVSTNGFGLANSFGGDEVYTQVKIRRIS